jgi:hypothetical protein
VLARCLAWAYALLYPAIALSLFGVLLSAEVWRANLLGDLVGLGLAGSAPQLGVSAWRPR